MKKLDRPRSFRPILLSLPFVLHVRGRSCRHFCNFISASILASLGDIYDGRAFGISLGGFASLERLVISYCRLSLVRNVITTYTSKPSLSPRLNTAVME